MTFWFEVDRPAPQLSAQPPRRRKYLRGDSGPYVMVRTEGLSNSKLAERLLEIAAKGDGGAPKTGRRYYYLALSHGYIQPDMSDTEEGRNSRDAAYGRVTNVLGTLRKQGRLGWDMVLDLTRELVEWQTFGSPREARAHLRRIYDEDRWIGQPNFPVLVVEKDTMVPVCEPMARRWQMPFASSRGYSSLKLQHDVAELIIRRYAKMLRRQQEATGQLIIVYFISDHDPSGLDLERAWKQALENFGARFVLVRIGLTLEQVGALDNERLREGIEVKPSDSRAQGYVEQYGVNRCWEVDILPAAVIEQALDEQIRSWLDARLWRQRDREIERSRALL
jgi:hypothetical protein